MINDFINDVMFISDLLTVKTFDFLLVWERQSRSPGGKPSVVPHPSGQGGMPLVGLSAEPLAVMILLFLLSARHSRANLLTSC